MGNGAEAMEPRVVRINMQNIFNSPRVLAGIMRTVLLVVLVVGIAACGSRSGSRSVAPVATGATAPNGIIGTEYRLGPGDKLKIVVFGHADVSGEFVLDGSGNVALPLVGQFKAGTRTVTELQDALQKTLNDQYIVNPRVSIEVLNYRPFFILGEVNKPGSYPYVAGIDVIQAVALGGGYTRRAKTSSVRVTRDTREGRIVLTLPPEAPVLPGDTLEVQRRLF